MSMTTPAARPVEATWVQEHLPTRGLKTDTAVFASYMTLCNSMAQWNQNKPDVWRYSLINVRPAAFGLEVQYK